MSETIIGRGLSYLSGQVASGQLEETEELRAYRTLLLLRASGANEKGVRRLFMENSDDLIGTVADILLNGFPQKTSGKVKLLRDDGGWSVELGGMSEIGATLFALGALYEFAWSVPNTEESLFYLLENLGLIKGRIGWDMISSGYRQAIEAEMIECISLFYWNRMEYEEEAVAVETRLVSLLAAVREGLFHGEHLEEHLYVAALLVRMFSMMGRAGDVSDLAALLERTQKADGHWEDSSVSSGLMVTCVAVEALAAFADASSGSVFIGMEVQGEGCDQSMTVQVEGVDSDMRIAVKVLDAFGGLARLWWQSARNPSLCRNISDLEPGSYRVDVSVMSPSSKGLAGRLRQEIEVKAWHEMRGLVRPELNLPKNVFVGDSVLLAPLERLDYYGNEQQEGRISWKVTAPNGQSIMEMPPEDVLLSENDDFFDGIEMQILSTMRENSLHGNYLLLSESGCHEVVVTLECEDGVFTSRAMINVNDISEIHIENELVPPVLSVAEAVGSVQLKLNSSKKKSSEQAEMIAGVRYKVLERKDMDGIGECHVQLEGICGQGGALLEDGWLAVRVDFGRITDGEAYVDELPEGSFTVHRVSKGCLNLSYLIEDKEITGTVPMQLYACIKQDGIVKHLERIGVVELLL